MAGEAEAGTGGVRVAVSLTGDVPIRLLEEAARLERSAADFVEWRLDHLREEATGDIARLARALREAIPTKKLILTLRSPGEGGSDNLPEGLRADVFRDAFLASGPDFVDVEREGDAKVYGPVDRLAREGAVARIGSRHVVDGTPPVVWMVDVLVDAYHHGYIPKLAVRARRLEDAARLLEATALARARGVRGLLITTAMGEYGQITRLVGGAFGSSVTFAALGRPSAPGQLPLETVVRMLGLMEALGVIAEDPDGSPLPD